MHDLDPKVLFADLLDSPAPPLPTRVDVLTGARRRLRRRRTARVAVAAGLFTVLVVFAGTIVTGVTPLGAGEFAGRPGDSTPAPLPPAPWSPPNGEVACSHERSTSSAIAVVPWPAGQNPTEVCRKEMSLLWRIRNRTLYTCVFRTGEGNGGAVVVVPGGGYSTAAEACGSIDLYLAPDDIAPNPAGNVNPDPEPTPEGTK